MTEELIEEEPVTQYGTVTVTVTDGTRPINNVQLTLSNANISFVGRTDNEGECSISEVPYGEYNVLVKRTGFISEEITLLVDDEEAQLNVSLTPTPKDPNLIEVDLDELYTFSISEKTMPDYTMSTNISSWLKNNLASLTDDNSNPIFGKVNNGFNENTLKTFGKNPVCDVYINRVDYEGNFECHIPQRVHTIVLFYLKGANNHTYEKACGIHDYLMQEFIENESFRRLDNIVSDTYILNSELRIQPLNKKWGVIGAFELSHTLY